MIRFLRFSVLVFASIVVSSCSRCGKGSSEQKAAANCPPRDVITIALPSLPNTLDWSQSHEQSAQNYPALLAMMRGLTTLDANNEVKPGLAASWEVSTNADNQQVYVFHLAPGLTWSDGKSPLRAQDFVFAWRRALLGADGAELEDLANAAAWRSEKTPEAGEKLGVKAIDDSTLQVTLAGPRSYFLSRLANVYPYFPAPSFELEGKPEAEVQKYFNEPKDGRPLVLGAFKVTAWDRVGQRLELEANPFYAEKPASGGVAKLVLLQSELSSLMYEQCNVDFLFFDEPSQLAKPPPDLASARLLSTYWLGFNTTKVPLELRQAIAAGIDRPALMSTLSALVPNARVAKVFLPPDMPGAVPDTDERLSAFPQADAAKAKAYFAANKREPLTMLVRGTGSFLPETAIAEGIRRQLAPLGLELKIVTTSNFSNDVKEADGTLRYDLFLKRTGADYAHPNTLLTPFQSGGNHYTDWQKLEGGAAIAKFEKLLAEGAATQDEAKRTQLYLDAQKVLLSEQVVAVPLYFPNRYFRKRPWLDGLSVDPFNFLTFRAMRVKQPEAAVKP